MHSFTWHRLRNAPIDRNWTSPIAPQRYLLKYFRAARPKPEAPVEILTIQPFLQYFGNVRDRTMRVARFIPADRIDWTYSPGKFTFGDLLRHVAVTERYMFAESVQGKPSRYTSHGKEFAESRDDIFLLMERLHQESMDIFAALSDADLQKKCSTPGNAPITTWKWLRSMAEHEIHHWGQIYIYLALIGVPSPPLYGLTSEEVRARIQA